MTPASAEKDGPGLPPDLRYEIQHEISEGTNPRLYKAKELGTGKALIVKVYHERAAGDEHWMVKYAFENEIAMLKLLRGGPHIIAAGSARYSQHPTPRIEWPITHHKYSLADLILQGGFKQLLLREHTVLAPTFYFMILAQMFSALAHIHGNGLIHRDIQPKNILCKQDFHFVLTGFANARHALPPPRGGIELLGCPQHVAPEITQWHPQTPAADIWSLGVVCLSMLALPPWDPANPNASKEDLATIWYKVMYKIGKLAGRPEIEMMVRIDPGERPTVFELINSPLAKLITEQYMWPVQTGLVGLLDDLRAGKADRLADIPPLPDPDSFCFLSGEKQGSPSGGGRSPASTRVQIAPKTFFRKAQMPGLLARPMPSQHPRRLGLTSLYIKPGPNEPKKSHHSSTAAANSAALPRKDSHDGTNTLSGVAKLWTHDVQISSEALTEKEDGTPSDCLGRESILAPEVALAFRRAESEMSISSGEPSALAMSFQRLKEDQLPKEPAQASEALPSAPEKRQRPEMSARTAIGAMKSMASATMDQADKSTRPTPQLAISVAKALSDSDTALAPQRQRLGAEQSPSSTKAQATKPSQLQTLSVQEPTSPITESSYPAPKLDASNTSTPHALALRRSTETEKNIVSTSSMARPTPQRAVSDIGAKSTTPARKPSGQQVARSIGGPESSEPHARSDPLPEGSNGKGQAAMTAGTPPSGRDGEGGQVRPLKATAASTSQPQQVGEMVAESLRPGDYLLCPEEDPGGWQQPNRKSSRRHRNLSCQNSESSGSCSGERPAEPLRAATTKAGKLPYSASSGVPRTPSSPQTQSQRKVVPTSTSRSMKASAPPSNPSTIKTSSSHHNPSLSSHRDRAPSHSLQAEVTPGSCFPADSSQACAGASNQRLIRAQEAAIWQEVDSTQKAERAKGLVADLEAMRDGRVPASNTARASDKVGASPITVPPGLDDSRPAAGPRQVTELLGPSRAPICATAVDSVRPGPSVTALDSECVKIVERIRALTIESTAAVMTARKTSQQGIATVDIGLRQSAESMQSLYANNVDINQRLEMHRILTEHSARHLELGKQQALECAKAIDSAILLERQRLLLNARAQSVVRQMDLAMTQSAGGSGSKDISPSHGGICSTQPGQQRPPSGQLGPSAAAANLAGPSRTKPGYLAAQQERLSRELPLSRLVQPQQQGAGAQMTASQEAGNRARQPPSGLPDKDCYHPPGHSQSLREQSCAPVPAAPGAKAPNQPQGAGARARHSPPHRLPAPARQEPIPVEAGSSCGARSVAGLAPGGRRSKSLPPKPKGKGRQDSPQATSQFSEDSQARGGPPPALRSGSGAKEKSWADLVDEEEKAMAAGRGDEWNTANLPPLPESFLPPPSASLARAAAVTSNRGQEAGGSGAPTAPAQQRQQEEQQPQKLQEGQHEQTRASRPLFPPEFEPGRARLEPQWRRQPPSAQQRRGDRPRIVPSFEARLGGQGIGGARTGSRAGSKTPEAVVVIETSRAAAVEKAGSC